MGVITALLFFVSVIVASAQTLGLGASSPFTVNDSSNFPYVVPVATALTMGASASFTINNSSNNVPYIVPITTTMCMSASDVFSNDSGHSAYSDSPRFAIRALPSVLIRCNTNQINDGTNVRYQYFAEQTVHLPFEIVSEVETNVVVWLNIAPLGNHGQISTNLALSLTLAPGTNHLELTWTLPAGYEPGYYDLIASVRLEDDTDCVLDTTAPGPGDADFDHAWLTGANTSIHVCRGNPVILIHGITGDRTTFGDMERLLTEQEHFATVSFDYHGMTDTDNEAATIENIAVAFMGVEGPILDDRGEIILNSFIWTNSIRHTLAYFDREKVDVVAHSMGGLITYAFMAGMADDGTVCYPYNNEIERLVTLGSPLYGYNPDTVDSWVKVVYDKTGHPLPRTQLNEMKLGSYFLWQLHGYAPSTVNHLAFAGKALKVESSDPVDHYSDAVVCIGSACAYTMADTPRYAANYAHIGGIPGWGDLPGIADVRFADGETHQGYLAVKQHLLNTGITAGLDPSALGLACAPVMIETVDTIGEPVESKIWHDAGTPDNEVPVVDTSEGIHAHQFVPSGYRTFTVRPTGFSASKYKEQQVSTELLPARLVRIGKLVVRDSSAQSKASGTSTMATNELVELVMQPCDDTDEDLLSDDFELRNFGSEMSSQTATNDPDGDELPNLWEQYMGYDPNDSNECFRIAAVSVLSSNQFEIILDTAPGVLYQVDTSVGGPNNWVTAGDADEGQGCLQSFNVSSDPDACIRIRAFLP